MNLNWDLNLLSFFSEFWSAGLDNSLHVSTELNNWNILSYRTDQLRKHPRLPPPMTQRPYPPPCNPQSALPHPLRPKSARNSQTFFGLRQTRSRMYKQTSSNVGIRGRNGCGFVYWTRRVFSNLKRWVELFLASSVLLPIASLIPLLMGVSVQSKSDRLMTSDAEMWNGRFAIFVKC